MSVEKVSPAKKGKAGELLVANELLRYGVDVFMPLVDTGIDIICLVNRKPILIQVKESREYPMKRKKRYWQQIREKSLLEHKADNMFYVFVLKATEEINYMVLPSMFIDRIKDKLEKIDGIFWLYFEFEGDKVIEGRKSHVDLTRYKNNFDLLLEGTRTK